MVQAVIIAYHSRFILPAGGDLNFQNFQKRAKKKAKKFVSILESPSHQLQLHGTSEADLK
jgi:hypothetical protein